MKAPPTRYRVVEKGRRLVVIDTRTGQPASGSGREAAASQPAGADPARPNGAAADTFTTQGWFDDKAPRRIRINYATRQRVSALRMWIAVAVALCVAGSFLFWPFVPILLVALAATPNLRKQARIASTRWIDTLDQTS